MNNYDVEKQKTLIVKIYHENSQSLLFLKKNLHIIMLLVFFLIFITCTCACDHSLILVLICIHFFITSYTCELHGL